MDQKYLRDFEGKCTQEDPPACQTNCPLHVEARAFVACMAKGALGEARKILERSMPLPGLTGFLCSGACMPHCRRAEVDGAVNLPLLERSCVSRTGPPRGMLMPGSGKAVAIAGAGLSSLAAAWELAGKGHSVTVFHVEPAGGRMRFLPAEVLPETALPEALARLESMRVSFKTLPDFTPAWKEAVLETHLALYLGLDDATVALKCFDLRGISNFLTQETAHPRIFAGGLLGGTDSFVPAASGMPESSFIQEAADGKRAAGSIIRLLQGVSPATAREHEGVYPTTLYTDLSSVAPAPAVVPEDPDRPTPEEAVAEAARCIQCECLECVKRCAWLARYKGYPKRYAREIYNNLSVVHGLRRTNTQINSCAECGLCAAVCPNGADMGAFCASARREMVQSNRMPPSAHEFALEDMAFSNAPDVAFFRHQPGTSSSAWAFFPGCQLPASLPERTEAVYAHLCRNLGNGVGFFFHCCGAPARWSGRDGLTAATSGTLRAAWEEAGRPALVLACASCTAFFAAELPDIPTLSLWDVLADLPLPDGARGSDRVQGGNPGHAPGRMLALHDPCASRHSHATRRSVRKLLEAAGQAFEELPLGREHTRCCGYGGLASAADPDMGDAYAENRAGDTDNTLLAYCINCRDRLRRVGKPAVHLLDVLFSAAAPGDEGDEREAGGKDTLRSASERPAPGISDRQRNRTAFRTRLLHSLWREPAPKDNPMDDIILRMSEEVEQRLEARRILHNDVRAVLRHAGEHGPQFLHPDNGRCLSSLRPKQVTFWVEYLREPDGAFRVYDAYCHRMVVPGTPGEGLPTAVTLEGYAPKGGRM